jgi:2-amino-4-hydroxy-6-hydroxymethyldihydropteridine diphosphokinase
MRVGVALGSNLGDRFKNLSLAARAISYLSRLPTVASRIYETDPVDCEPGANKFLNVVIEFEFNGDPLDLLEKVKKIEVSMGRPAEHPRNVSRKIDIDLLYADDIVINNERLQLPHPRMHLRRFVLQPLADIRPDLVLPNQTNTVRELLAQIQDSTKVIRYKAKW